MEWLSQNYAWIFHEFGIPLIVFLLEASKKFLLKYKKEHHYKLEKHRKKTSKE